MLLPAELVNISIFLYHINPNNSCYIISQDKKGMMTKMYTLSFIFPNKLEALTGHTYEEWVNEFSSYYKFIDYDKGGKHVDCIISPKSFGRHFTQEQIPRLLRIENELFKTANFDEIRSQVAKFIQDNSYKDK